MFGLRSLWDITSGSGKIIHYRNFRFFHENSRQQLGDHVA